MAAGSRSREGRCRRKIYVGILRDRDSGSSRPSQKSSPGPVCYVISVSIDGETERLVHSLVVFTVTSANSIAEPVTPEEVVEECTFGRDELA